MSQPQSYQIIQFTLCILFPLLVDAQYRETEHIDIPEGVIAVSGPGNYGKSGSTYMLTKDITSDLSYITRAISRF